MVLALTGLIVLASLTCRALTARRGLAAGLCFAIALIYWAAAAQELYLSPIPPNEPEWWGGLTAAVAIAGVGYAFGEALRRIIAAS